jgi:poly-gamma-glutamate capsule biosynthesis protein CapA/YwtB (metallophosphatase superfamily)
LTERATRSEEPDLSSSFTAPQGSFRIPEIFFLSFILSLCLSPNILASSPRSTRADSSQKVILLFGGDCLFAEHYEREVGNDIHHAFEKFDLFRNADVAMVNLEGPVTLRGTKQTKPFTFRMLPVHVDILTKAGIDLVNIANNHIFDYGIDGLYDTVQYLDSAGVNHVGAGMDGEAAHRPVILDVKGVRIGFLGYYGGKESPWAAGGSPGVARRNIDLIGSDVRELRTRDHVDFVVVNLHWGTEKATSPDSDQVDFAHHIVDLGAEIVIGHHPHVLQAVESYRSAIIAYSLGNLIFGGNGRSSYDTAVLEIRLDQSSINYRLLPVRVSEWGAQPLLGDEADSLLNNIDQLPIPGVNRSTNKEIQR